VRWTPDIPRLAEVGPCNAHRSRPSRRRPPEEGHYLTVAGIAATSRVARAGSPCAVSVAALTSMLTSVIAWCAAARPSTAVHLFLPLDRFKSSTRALSTSRPVAGQVINQPPGSTADLPSPRAHIRTPMLSVHASRRASAVSQSQQTDGTLPM